MAMLKTNRPKSKISGFKVLIALYASMTVVTIIIKLI
jgi:hypothetical protein